MYMKFVVVVVSVLSCCYKNNKMINETQKGHKQKYEFTYMVCSIIHNSIFLLLLLFLLFLLLVYNFVVATTLHMRNAIRSSTSGQLDMCNQMYPLQMSYEKSSYS